MKYLATIFLILQYTTPTYASAYLPNVGKYKYSISAVTIDTTSKKRRAERLAILAEIQDTLYVLGNKKEEIVQAAKEQNRPLRNSEIRELEYISSTMDKLTNAALGLNSFNEDNTSCFEVEYGASENQSFGLKINYTLGKFAEIQNNNLNKTTNVGKNLEAFYKHKLFQNDRIIVTLQPALGYHSYNDSLAYKIDLGLLIGHSEQNKNTETFQELGLIARQHLQKNTNTHLGYVVSLSEGIKFKNGVILSNYTEIQRSDSPNFIYNTMIYEQVSIAKEFYFASLKTQTFTAQIGYFWKGSMTNSIYTISGPIFSLWCDL